ncbi:MAG: hypothetical protein CL820_07520 [Croceicoccus sp.]|jgi:hypothetical protein|nr:hypothetical protein [Croceicoccus sp.]PNQ77770.1 hypothetical protein BA950_01700 [Erythrobacter sp. SAORIC-644]
MSRLLEFRFLALEIYKQTVHFPPHLRSCAGLMLEPQSGMAALSRSRKIAAVQQSTQKLTSSMKSSDP